MIGDRTGIETHPTDVHPGDIIGTPYGPAEVYTTVTPEGKAHTVFLTSRGTILHEHRWTTTVLHRGGLVTKEKEHQA